MASGGKKVRKRSKPQLAAIAKTPRPLAFELHIRPMFRSLDREHMDFALNLWQYNDSPSPGQQQFYERILNRLKSSDAAVVMPPPNEGGPWPPEWIALFERWIDEGMRRLGRATANVATFQAIRDLASLTVTITGQGTKSSPGHVAWIERAFDPGKLYGGDLADQFVLYEEQRAAATPTATAFAVDDFFDVPAELTQLTIIDSAGPHLISIT